MIDGSSCGCSSRFVCWSSAISFVYTYRIIYSFFANDTSLFVVDDLPEQAAMILNTDLKQFLIGLIPGLKHLMQAKQCH